MARAARGVLVDTSILIAHLRGRLALQELVRDYDGIYISAITLYELEYGASRAGRTSDLVRLQLAFGPTVLTLGHAEAQRAAQMNGTLARKNQQIGPRDAFIAGTALQRGLELLTLNVAEFRRVPGLSVVTPP
jgi:tRNA(fMet)-specific endonuclease VapC